MATTRFARLRLRATQFRTALPIVVVTAALAALVGPAATSAAAPQLSISQVEARVHALNERAEKITESFNLARERLTTLRREQTVAARQLQREERRLAAVRRGIAATADAAYRSGGVGTFILGGADSAEQFLDQAVTLDAISRSQSQQFATAAAAGHAVEVAKAQYDARAVAVRSSLDRIKAQKAHIEDLLAQARHLLSSLAPPTSGLGSPRPPRPNAASSSGCGRATTGRPVAGPRSRSGSPTPSSASPTSTVPRVRTPTTARA